MQLQSAVTVQEGHMIRSCLWCLSEHVSMATFLESAARLLNSVSGGKLFSKYKKMSDAGSPNVYIFPQTIVDHCGNTHLDKNYSPLELLQSILLHPHAVESVGHTLVTSVYYYKATTGAQHEFLIFRVQNSRLVNFIKLDRCPEIEPVTPPKSIFASQENGVAYKQSAYVTL